MKYIIIALLGIASAVNIRSTYRPPTYGRHEVQLVKALNDEEVDESMASIAEAEGLL